MRLRACVLLALLGPACSGDGAGGADGAIGIDSGGMDARSMDAAWMDAGGMDGGGLDAGEMDGDVDAAGPDAATTNPTRLWLAGIGGSESNLELVESGPPDPF